jgi:hypothetical protein
MKTTKLYEVEVLFPQEVVDVLVHEDGRTRTAGSRNLFAVDTLDLAIFSAKQLAAQDTNSSPQVVPTGKKYAPEEFTVTSVALKGEVVVP